MTPTSDTHAPTVFFIADFVVARVSVYLKKSGRATEKLIGYLSPPGFAKVVNNRIDRQHHPDPTFDAATFFLNGESGLVRTDIRVLPGGVKESVVDGDEKFR